VTVNIPRPELAALAVQVLATPHAVVTIVVVLMQEVWSGLAALAVEILAAKFAL
jgi:hypothetical protein